MSCRGKNRPKEPFHRFCRRVYIASLQICIGVDSMCMTLMNMINLSINLDEKQNMFHHADAGYVGRLYLATEFFIYNDESVLLS